ncbi:Uncharacterized protein DAT39_015990, partial [Clarias magur]
QDRCRKSLFPKIETEIRNPSALFTTSTPRRFPTPSRCWTGSGCTAAPSHSGLITHTHSQLRTITAGEMR